jgi:hypothetical protein
MVSAVVFALAEEKDTHTLQMKRYMVSAVVLTLKEENTHILQVKRHIVSAVVLAFKMDKDTHPLQDEKTQGQCCGSCFGGGETHSHTTK